MNEICHRELAQARLPDAPYPGLRPFEPNEWSIFFGREVMASEVIARLGRQNLIIVHGGSGCGKSSLVRAGVLPALQGDHELHRKEFRYAIIRPSQGPLDSLDAALLRELGPPNPDDPDESWLERLAIEPDLVGLIERKLAAANATFCLIVDQFEEIFRWAEDKDRGEAEFLVEFMIAVAKGVPRRNLFILTTMRSDYLGQCARFKDFAAVVNDCQYLLDNLDEFAVLRAIHEPAERFGGSVAPVLADRLRFGARDDPDALPVLQHTLMRMYDALPDKGEGWMLDLPDLERVSGEDGALSQHAEDIYREVREATPDHVGAVEWIFRALTELDAGGRAIRRPRSLDELQAVAGAGREILLALIDAFSRPGRNFLVVAELDSGDCEVDVSHEAFIRRWRRIGDNSVDPETGQRTGWLYREFQAGLTWKAMAVFAKRGETSLEPHMTRQWLPFFEQVEKRPAWAARYFVDPLPCAAPEEQPEWVAVTRLMAVSKKRLERESNRWRRALIWGWSYLGLVAVIAVIIAIFGFLKLLGDREAAGIALAAAQQEARTADERTKLIVARAESQAKRKLDVARDRILVANARAAQAAAVSTKAQAEMRQARAAAASASLQLSQSRLEAERILASAQERVDQLKAQTAFMGEIVMSMEQVNSYVVSRHDELTGLILDNKAGIIEIQPLPDDFSKGLREVMARLGGGSPFARQIADVLESNRKQYGLDNDRKLAAFLAVSAYDTNGFTNFEEEERQTNFILEGFYALDMKNDQPGDDDRYHGRGLIFLRGRNNYQYIGDQIGKSLVDEPNLMLEPETMVQAALAWWEKQTMARGIYAGGEGATMNQLADLGDILEIWRILSPQVGDQTRFEALEREARDAIADALAAAGPN